MINYTIEFAKKKFTADSKKEAYLKAIKWVAKNVMSKVELQDVLVKYEKDVQFPTITVHLYAGMSEESIREEHCKICKQMHKSFFINENCNCDWCNTKAYQRRSDQMIKTKCEFYRETLNKIQEEY